LSEPPDTCYQQGMWLLVVLALLGFGCARAEYEHRQYPHPLTEEGRAQLARDRYECERENRGDPRLTRLCLEARGWSRVPR
jgi:hypothetical protein